MDNLPMDEEGQKAVATVGGMAAAGAIAGSFIPGVGTAVGAGVGAILAGAGIVVKKLTED